MHDYRHQATAKRGFPNKKARGGTMFPLAVAVLLTTTVGVAAHERCGFVDSPHVRARAELDAERAQFRADSQARASGRDHRRGVSNTPLEIPVVFHIVYNATDPGLNLSDAIIASQIAVLNEDFSAQNADLSTLNPSFAARVGNANIRFKLVATLRYDADPICNLSYKITARHPPWDTSRFLNVYSCDWFESDGSSTAGAAQFPGASDNTTDVVFLNAPYVGPNSPIASPAYDLGRTATHEVGHWLGLFHVWGLSEDCLLDDYIADTPTTSAKHLGTCLTTDSMCGQESMVQNHMDYQEDACAVAFTKGQVHRMRSTLDDPMGWRRHLAVPACGDGVVQATEECDDGNTVQNDGCTACSIDLGFVCPNNGVSCARDGRFRALFHEPFPASGPLHAWSATTSMDLPAPGVFSTDTSDGVGGSASPVACWRANLRTGGLPTNPGAFVFRTMSSVFKIPLAGETILEFWMKLDTEVQAEIEQLIPYCGGDAVRLRIFNGSNAVVAHSDNFPYTSTIIDPAEWKPVATAFPRGWCSANAIQLANWEQGGAIYAGLAREAWHRVTVDLSSFAGDTIALGFEVLAAGSTPASASFKLDDLRVLTTASTTSSAAPTTADSASDSTPETSLQETNVTGWVLGLVFGILVAFACGAAVALFVKGKIAAYSSEDDVEMPETSGTRTLRDLSESELEEFKARQRAQYAIDEASPPVGLNSA